jgi:hypothetical protein
MEVAQRLLETRGKAKLAAQGKRPREPKHLHQTGLA